MRPAAVGLVFLTACQLSLTAAADEGDILMSRPDAAMCAASLTETPILRAKIATLEQDLVLKDRALDAYARLQALDEQIVAKEQRLRQLAEGERDVFKEQTSRAEGKNRWLRCGAGAGFGALAGSAVMPPIGTGAGAILGCLGGLLGF